MSNDLNTPRNDDAQPLVKPYHKPELIVYGDIREITKNVGTTSQKNDGGGGGKTKTS
jgi:hypothetical protein